VLDGRYDEVLETAHRLALGWLDGLADRGVAATMSGPELHRRIDQPMPTEPTDPSVVLEELAAAIGPGLAATGSGRYFGFVNGGTLPAGLGADWLVSAWDQNTAFALATPGAAAFEEVAGRWIREALGLPAQAAVGFVTGAQMANTTCLAAARHRVLRAQGHDVETDGLIGAPAVRVIVGAERHSTIDRSLRLLGLGTAGVVTVPTDGAGRMDAAALGRLLGESDAATIVCAQAGNVNGGAFDPIGAIVEAMRDRGRSVDPDSLWLHVDGAFGLWVAASPALAGLVDGIEGADSWATDAHKWLNTPYDCGLAIVADRAVLRQSMALRAAYLPPATPSSVSDPLERSPEASRRARALVVWATLRSLGRSGLSDLIEGCCARASEFAAQLGAVEGVEVLQAEINQLVVGFDDPSGVDDDGHAEAVLARVQDEGTCYMTGTSWHGRRAMRISVSNWRTDSEDVRRSVAAIAAAHLA
jgi:glutamate/tyrosine decarboxylase-like PLP-dependent enzyme